MDITINIWWLVVLYILGIYSFFGLSIGRRKDLKEGKKRKSLITKDISTFHLFAIATWWPFVIFILSPSMDSISYIVQFFNFVKSKPIKKKT